MGKLGLVIAAADGIMSLQSGVGMVVNFFFEAFGEIAAALPEWDIDLYAACPRVNAGSSDFSPNAFELVNRQCRQYNGRVIPLANLSSGNSLNEVWKGTAQHASAAVWESCCQALAAGAESLDEAYDKIIILAHDTLFVNLSGYVADPRVEVCWIPHSLGTLFKDPNQGERIRFEQEKITNLRRRGDKIGYISHFTKAHLLEHYGVTGAELVSFYSGIYFNSHKYRQTGLIGDFMGRHRIPAAKKLIFSWGRCSDQKGIDIIIEAYGSILRENPHFGDEYHLVLLCPTETTYEEYLAGILLSLGKLPAGSCSFIAEFQEKVQYEILSYANTRFVLLCSRYESFGLTSIEALYKTNPSATIIYAPLPTFREVLAGGSAVELAENSAACLEKVLLAQSQKSLPGLSAPGQRAVLGEKFSIEKNYSYGLSQLVPKELLTEK